MKLKLIRNILSAIIILHVTDIKAQISFNGNFEQLDYSGLPKLWFCPSAKPNYELYTDTIQKLQGRNAYHVSAKKNVVANDGVLIFQTIHLPNKTTFDSVAVIYHIKFLEGDSANFRHFIRPQSCNTSNGQTKKETIQLGSLSNGWKELSVSVVAKDPTCNNIFVGFIVVGQADIVVDSISIKIDSKQIKDIPPPEFKNCDLEMDTFLKSNALHLEYTEGKKNLKELSFLKSSINNASVVALGEGTHGTHEFITLRNRIISYLVDSLDFEIVAFENIFSATHQLTPLLDNNSYSINKLVDSFFYSIHKTQEMIDLLELVRSKRKEGREIRIEGFDNQEYRYLKQILFKIFKDNDSLLFEQLNKIDKYDNTSMFTTGKFDTLAYYSKQLLDSFYKRKIYFDNTSTTQSFQEVEKYIISLVNDYHFYYLKALDYKVGRDGTRQNNFRDSLMADNILWLKKMYPNKKIIVIAHNEHIKTDFDTISKKPNSMGAFLSQKLKSKYRNFAMLTGEGQATGYIQFGQPNQFDLQKPDPDTYEYYFSKAQEPIFYLKLREKNAPTYQLPCTLKVRSIGQNYSVGSQFYSLNLFLNYDGLFFIKKTTPSNSIYKK